MIKKGVISCVILVPGGGTRANFVRDLDKKFGLGDDLAHWMAIFAMNQNGFDACENNSSLKCIKAINRLKFHLKKGNLENILIFLPYEWLRSNDILPHSWDVTSDSITIILANELGLTECFLIKNIDGIYVKSVGGNVIKQEFSSSEYRTSVDKNKLTKLNNNTNFIKSSRPIDDYITTLIDKYKISCTLINGSCLNSRILKYFNNSTIQEKVFTKIYSNL